MGGMMHMWARRAICEIVTTPGSKRNESPTIANCPHRTLTLTMAVWCTSASVGLWEDDSWKSHRFKFKLLNKQQTT